MPRIYVPCPKCDDEHRFSIVREFDCWSIEDESSNCSCEIPEQQMDILRRDALELVESY